jgi:NAD(P)H-quinone oxidoreductase subunit 5
MGLYSAALLHVIAHSFYKAHAFLSSGSAVDKHRLSQLNGEQMNHISLLQFLIGTGLSTLLFFLLSNYWLAEIVQLNIPMLLLGAIIVIGVSNILVRTAAQENNISLVLKSIVLTGLVLLSFFIMEKGMHALMANTIPHFAKPNWMITMASIVLVAMFFVINTIALIPLEHRVKLNVYRKNGFYIHVFVDQLIKKRYTNLLK